MYQSIFRQHFITWYWMWITPRYSSLNRSEESHPWHHDDCYCGNNIALPSWEHQMDTCYDPGQLTFKISADSNLKTDFGYYLTNGNRYTSWPRIDQLFQQQCNTCANISPLVIPLAVCAASWATDKVSQAATPLWFCGQELLHSQWSPLKLLGPGLDLL